MSEGVFYWCGLDFVVAPCGTPLLLEVNVKSMRKFLAHGNPGVVQIPMARRLMHSALKQLAYHAAGISVNGCAASSAEKQAETQIEAAVGTETQEEATWKWIRL